MEQVRESEVNIKERILQAYSRFAEFSFYIFVFGTLSFGRAFSALHVNTPLAPLFSTEIFLLLNTPALLYKRKSLSVLPKKFLAPLLIFFCFGCYYLCVGFFSGNMLALRDITLSVYILFLPITLIHMDSLNKLKLFILTVFLGNITNLYAGQCLLLSLFPSEAFRSFILNTKVFNLGLYYGIAISFIIPFYKWIRLKVYRLSALIILSLNFCMIIMFNGRSLWIATLSSLIFFCLLLKRKFLKIILLVVPILIFTIFIMLYFDSKTVSSLSRERISSQVKGSGMFLRGISYQYNPAEEPPEIVALSNIAWRRSIWRQTLKFSSDSILFGKGFGRYPVYRIGPTFQYPDGLYLNSRMVPAHNHIVTVFLKMGILGLGLFFFINVYAFVYAISYIGKCRLRPVNSLLTALLGSFVFWHSLALFFDVIDSPPTSVFLWIIMGMVFAAIEIDKKSIHKDAFTRGKIIDLGSQREYNPQDNTKEYK